MVCLTPGACWCPRTTPTPDASPPATQHAMGDVTVQVLRFRSHLVGEVHPGSYSCLSAATI